MKESWEFCPYCGEEIGRRIERRKINFSPFKIFSDIEKEFEKIDKFVDFKPFKTRGGGISITIHSNGKVYVKTSGDYKKIEPEIKRKLGIRPKIEEVEEEKRIRSVKITEEPKSKVKTIGRKQILMIELPGVKAEDIEVRRLEQSIEIKAFAGNKVYFKLIPVPADASISKEFKKGVLKIEIEK